MPPPIFAVRRRLRYQRFARLDYHAAGQPAGQPSCRRRSSTAVGSAATLAAPRWRDHQASVSRSTGTRANRLQQGQVPMLGACQALGETLCGRDRTRRGIARTVQALQPASREASAIRFPLDSLDLPADSVRRPRHLRRAATELATHRARDWPRRCRCLEIRGSIYQLKGFLPARLAAQEVPASDGPVNSIIDRCVFFASRGPFASPTFGEVHPSSIESTHSSPGTKLWLVGRWRRLQKRFNNVSKVVRFSVLEVGQSGGLQQRPSCTRAPCDKRLHQGVDCFRRGTPAEGDRAIYLAQGVRVLPSPQ